MSILPKLFENAYPKIFNNIFDPASNIAIPLKLSPVFWTDPTTYLTTYNLSGSNISSAGDLSTSNIPAVQASAGNQPIIDPTGINGKPAIRFTSASSQYLTANAVSNFATGDDKPMCVFIVFRKVTNNGMTPWNFSNSANNNPVMWNVHNADTTSTIFRRATSGYGIHTSSITTTTNTNYVLCFNFTGTSYDYHINNQVVSGALDLNTMAINQFSIGAVTRASPGSFFDGWIGDVIVYNKYLSSAQRLAVMQYLGTKYGVTVV